MVFKNLPIEFDVYGRASLRDEEAKDPFDYASDARIQRAFNHELMLEKLSGNPGVRTFEIDPVTRTGGRFTLSTMIDFDHRRTLDAHVECGQFARQSGAYEVILKDRKPSDAVHISRRVCGSSSGARAIASGMAVCMSAAAAAPSRALFSRNVGCSG